MELVDIFKIVVPIIIALCGTVAGTVAWIFLREGHTKEKQDEATKEYWQAVHASLEKMIADLSSRVTEFNAEHGSWQNKSDDRVRALEREFGEFRVMVSGEYLKREIWGTHAQNMERKLDQLRIDVNKELKELIEKIADWSKQK